MARCQDVAKLGGLSVVLCTDPSSQLQNFFPLLSVCLEYLAVLKTGCAERLQQRRFGLSTELSRVLGHQSSQSPDDAGPTGPGSVPRGQGGNRDLGRWGACPKATHSREVSSHPRLCLRGDRPRPKNVRERVPTLRKSVFFQLLAISVFTSS